MGQRPFIVEEQPRKGRSKDLDSTAEKGNELEERRIT